MSYIRAALARIAGAFSGSRADEELREELQAHLEMEIADDDTALSRSEDCAQSRPARTHHASACCGDDRPAPFLGRTGNPLHGVGVLVRDDYRLDRFW